MASRVQIVISVDAAQAGQAVDRLKSGLTGLGATSVRVTDQGTRGFQKFESQGLLKAVLGANLLERAIFGLASRMKQAIVDSTVLSARFESAARVQTTLADNVGLSASVLAAQQRQVESNRVSVLSAQQGLAKFAAAQLNTNDAVLLSGVALNRAAISGRSVTFTYERLLEAVLKAEPELVDEFGIILRLNDANKALATSLGKTVDELTKQERQQALLNQVLEQTANDTGLAEAAFAALGARLADLPRRAERAAIAFGRSFQDELAVGVDALERTLEFIERNADETIAYAKTVVALAAAYGLLKVATSELALVNAGLGLSSLIASLGGVGDAITTARLLLMGAGGTVGLVGAFGLLAAAAGAAGFAVGELLGVFLASRELDKVAEFNFEAARESLAKLGVEVKSVADIEAISARLSVVNAARREEGLVPLKANAELLKQLDAEEKRLRQSTEAGTASIVDRTKAIAQLNDQLEQRSFTASLVGLGEADTIRERASREIDQLLAKAREFPAAAGRITETIAAINQATDIQLDQLRSRQRDESSQFLLAALDRNVGGIEKIEAARDAELAKAREISKRFPELRDLAARAEVEIAEQALTRIGEIRAREFEQAESLVRGLERQAALGEADPFERIQLERVARLEEIDRNLNLSQGQLERAREAINAESNAAIRDENQRVADEQLRAWQRNAGEYERFLDRMVRFTEQSGSFLNNIWRTIADEFRRSVTKMVVSWLLGLRQIQGAATSSSGSGGGILGGLLGGIFGGGIGGVSARTPPFVNNSFPGGIPGIGVGSPAAGGIPGAVPPGAGQAAAGFGFAGLPGGQGALLGLLLGTSVASDGRPLLGALAGIGGTLGGVALGGAAAGTAGGIGALSGAGTALLGFLTNPIGLAILGGIAGVSVLVGVLSRGRKKEDASRIANEGFQAIDQQIRSFELRQSSFDSTVSAMNQVWEQMAQAWQEIGGSVGQRSISSQRPFFDAKLRQVEELQRRRNERGDIIAGLPIPEFATGGPVIGSNAPILAGLHPGEFVLNRDAVKRIGMPTLEAVNSGGGDALGDITVVIQTPDKSGVEEMLKANATAFQRFVKAVIRRSAREGGPAGGFAT